MPAINSRLRRNETRYLFPHKQNPSLWKDRKGFTSLFLQKSLLREKRLYIHRYRLL